MYPSVDSTWGIHWEERRKREERDREGKAKSKRKRRGPQGGLFS